MTRSGGARRKLLAGTAACGLAVWSHALADPAAAGPQASVQIAQSSANGAPTDIGRVTAGSGGTGERLVQ